MRGIDELSDGNTMIFLQSGSDGAVDEFDQTLKTYQTTGDEKLADVLLDLIDGCLGQATLDEYDLNLKWDEYDEGRSVSWGYFFS